MLQKLFGKIWRVSPRLFRAYLVRLTQKTFTVSAGAVVTNEEGKVLLLDHVFRPSPSGWGIPGGFINENEQPEEALRREIAEEIGLAIDHIELVQARTRRRHLEILFRARASGEGEVRSGEIKAVGWFAFDEMPAEMDRAQKELIRQILGPRK